MFKVLKSLTRKSFSLVATIILLAALCVCTLSEKRKTLQFVSGYWIIQIGINALFQIVDALYQLRFNFKTLGEISKLKKSSLTGK